MALPGTDTLNINGILPLTQDLLSQGAVTSDTVLYLVNAIYFGVRWRFQFEKHKNVDEDFHVSNSETKQVTVLNNFSDLNKNVVDCALGIFYKYVNFFAVFVDHY